MKPRRKVRPHGQIRQSQVVTTFGPGSMIDLPKQSIIFGGLEYWNGEKVEVHEKRLVEKLQRLLDLPQLRLFAPPPENDEAPIRPEIIGWQFPEYFVTQNVLPGPKGEQIRSRLLIHRTALTGDGFIDDHKKKLSVVPIRFVRACPNGHIGDIEWRRFVHLGAIDCARQLWVDEKGTSGDLTEISIRCECGKRRELAVAQMALGAFGVCDGSRPWLGMDCREGCGLPARLLIRSASNAYFPQVMSVISLPDPDESIEKAVDQIFADYLENLDSIEELRFARKKMAPVKTALEGFKDEEVWKEVQSRKSESLDGPTKSVKQAEFEVLSATKESAGTDLPDGDFYARALPREMWDKPWMSAVERVVLVHRLREVIAQVGFTRFEASSPDVEGELQVGVKKAPLANETTWLPAVENRGEGIFIQFRASAISDWLRKSAVIVRGQRLMAGFEVWAESHPHSARKYPGLAYYLLHTISHMLLTTVSLECGYPASSIRERVYSLDAGFGILLYTGSPDAEGTLGGLIETGRQIHRHFRAALELARLCSNDPVCAQHDPPNQHEARFMHGAACHGCLLVAETSCEQQNDFLDRALVVPTVEDVKAEFFTA